jgi:hypothetical protein
MVMDIGDLPFGDPRRVTPSATQTATTGGAINAEDATITILFTLFVRLGFKFYTHNQAAWSAAQARGWARIATRSA